MSTPAPLVNEPVRVRAALYDRFKQAYSDKGAALLPEGAVLMPQLLIDAATWILTHCPTPDLPPGVVRRLHAWALDLRRIGFPSAEFPTVAGMLADVAEFDTNARAVILAAAEEMRRAAADADEAGIPAASAAQVMEVNRDGAHRHGRASKRGGGDAGVRVVRLESGMPVDYLPGQVLPVMQVGRQGVWRGLAPAMPSNSLGQLEFHVDGEIDPKVGSYLTLGAARGPSPALDGKRALIVASGSGLAAAKSLVFALLERETRPQVHLIVAAESPADFYDLPAFAVLAKAQDWLEVTRAVEHDTADADTGDADGAGGPDGARGGRGAGAGGGRGAGQSAGAVGADGSGAERAVAELPQIWAPLTKLVAAPGIWWDRDVVLCGTQARTDELHNALLQAGAGAQAGEITVIAHDAAPDWTSPPEA